MIKISGASDDLLEFEGIFHDEFDCYNHEKISIIFSNGTIISGGYGLDNDPFWKFNIISGDAKKIQIADDKNYTDIIEINSTELTWMIIFIDQYVKFYFLGNWDFKDFIQNNLSKILKNLYNEE
jgi:hypothetical protein